MVVVLSLSACVYFFFNDTATTEIYTLSLHDALPIRRATSRRQRHSVIHPPPVLSSRTRPPGSDRKSTRLNSSHVESSYAVFCLKKKRNKNSILLLRIVDNTIN